jgi:ABC-2 type transport system ATP-binding protein
VAEEGRTVIFSSHLLEEIERVSDHIAMLHRGRIVMCGPLDEIKAQHRRVTLRFETPQATPPVIAGALSVSGRGKEWTVICNGARAQLPTVAASLGARIVEEHGVSLNEIFIAHAGEPIPAPAGGV